MAERSYIESLSMYYSCLNQDHLMTRAREVNPRQLEPHLLLFHAVSINKTRTRGELGKLHLLVHAIIAYPELAELMGLPPGFGSGKKHHQAP